MKAVIQRVLNAKVSVDNKVSGEIEKGYLVLLGVMADDEKSDAQLLAKKVSALRVFTDENYKMNKSILDIDGEILVVSQFTLCADLKKGNRPSFDNSANPEKANELYEYFCSELKNCGIKKVETGIFGAHMAVELLNDGPVTILYDTTIWKK